MGAWGTDILEDDTAVDVYADYMERFEAGMEPAAIRAELEAEYADAIDDDDMTSFWLALAKAQWECGQLQPDKKIDILNTDSHSIYTVPKSSVVAKIIFLPSSSAAFLLASFLPAFLFCIGISFLPCLLLTGAARSCYTGNQN